ncbi:hypothetical protein [Legionella sp. WA2022007384]
MLSRFFAGPVKAVAETTGYSLAAAAVGSGVYRFTTFQDKSKEKMPVSQEQENTPSNTKLNF